MKNKKVITEINRVREIMGTDLLNEQQGLVTEQSVYQNTYGVQSSITNCETGVLTTGWCVDPSWGLQKGDVFTITFDWTGVMESPKVGSTFFLQKMYDGVQCILTSHPDDAYNDFRQPTIGPINDQPCCTCLDHNPALLGTSSNWWGSPSSIYIHTGSIQGGWCWNNGNGHPGWGCEGGTVEPQEDQCQCCNDGQAQSMNGLVPAGTCSSYNSNTLTNCQVSPAQGGTISCGTQSEEKYTCTYQQCDNPSAVMANSTHCCIPDPNGQHSNLLDCMSNCSNFGAGWFCLPPGGGGQGSCQYTPTMTIGLNGPFPTEQDCETAAYCAGSTSIDCTQYGVDYNPTTLDNAQGGWFTQGLTLATNGQCQGIQNKILQVSNIPNQEKRDCRLDYLNLLLALCQSNAGSCTAWTATNGPWIGEMEDRYNGLGAPQHAGCWGPNGNHTQSVCGRKAHFCPGSTPSKQCKCDWLTTFTAQNNCNC